MTDVKSKNLYELLGNDHDQDSDKEPEPPTKAIDKPVARSGKRDAPAVDKSEAAPRNRDPERRRGGFTGNEQAFRDRTAGSRQNRDLPVEGDSGNARGTQRGGRAPRGPRRGGDRHSRTGRGDHQKQVGHGWGRSTGEGEQADEKAGDRMAAQEIKEEGFDANEPAAPVDADGNVPAADAAADEMAEPEDSHKSYADYLAEQAQKKLEGLGLKEARAPNEGSKENKKWNAAKELSKENDEENYFIGEAKAKRERDRSSKKNVLDIDYTFKEQSRESAGRGRGSRGRGDRGGRGRGEFRGGRGGERGGERGSYRGGRGSFRGNSDGPNVAVGDESAFPALGGK